MTADWVGSVRRQSADRARCTDNSLAHDGGASAKKGPSLGQ